MATVVSHQATVLSQQPKELRHQSSTIAVGLNCVTVLLALRTGRVRGRQNRFLGWAERRGG